MLKFMCFSLCLFWNNSATIELEKMQWVTRISFVFFFSLTLLWSFPPFWRSTFRLNQCLTFFFWTLFSSFCSWISRKWMRQLQDPKGFKVEKKKNQKHLFVRKKNLRNCNIFPWKYHSLFIVLVLVVNWISKYRAIDRVEENMEYKIFSKKLHTVLFIYIVIYEMRVNQNDLFFFIGMHNHIWIVMTEKKNDSYQPIWMTRKIKYIQYRLYNRVNKSSLI